MRSALSIGRLPHNDIGLTMLILLSMSCSGISGVKVCGPESRATTMSGQVGPLADGTSSVYSAIMISEVRQPGRPETEVATVNMGAQSYIGASSGSPSDFLRGHVTGVELRDTQTPSRLLGSFPPYTGPLPPDQRLLPPGIFWFDGSYGWPVPVEEARALLLAGQLVLTIQTDLPSQPLVSISISGPMQNDATWHRMTGEGCG